MIVLVAFLF